MVPRHACEFEIVGSSTATKLDPGLALGEKSWVFLQEAEENVGTLAVLGAKGARKGEGPFEERGEGEKLGVDAGVAYVLAEIEKGEVRHKEGLGFSP